MLALICLVISIAFSLFGYWIQGCYFLCLTLFFGLNTVYNAVIAGLELQLAKPRKDDTHVD